MPFTITNLQEILVEEAGLDAHDFPDDLDTTYDKIGVDSLGRVQMQLTIEHEYGVAMTDHDLATLTTPRSTIDFVNERMREVTGNGANR
jgi:act minimal PKS acyl carrier protein